MKDKRGGDRIMFWVCILGSKITYIFKADNGNVEDCPWTRYAFLRVTDHKQKSKASLSHSLAHLVKKKVSKRYQLIEVIC